jgi:hypothetical protein
MTVAAAEKEFKQAQEIAAAFVRDSEKLLDVAHLFPTFSWSVATWRLD